MTTRHLEAAQPAGRVEVRHVVPALVVRAVVGREEHERVIRDTRALERAHELADVGVEVAHDRRVVALGFG